MNKEKISVIVPIYNVERYIEKCLESLIYQTYSNIEIICVDDNTPDSSAKICENYSQRDSRITLIHKKHNAGLAAARNAGLLAATGDYIAFVDSDDWVSPDYLETLYNLLIDNNADIAQGSYVRSAVEISESSIRTMDEKTECLTGKEALYRMFSEQIIQPYVEYTVVWNKLYRKSIIESMRFIEGRIFEDQYFSGICFYNCKKFVATSKKIYFYRKNTEGITMQNYNLKFLDELEMHKQLIKYFELNKEKDFRNLIAARCISLAVDHYLRGIYFDDYRARKKSYIYILENYGYYLKNKKISLFYKIAIFLFLVCPDLFFDLKINIYNQGV